MLATCAAAVAVEELARQRYGALQTPAAAFMALALCGGRHLIVAVPTAVGHSVGCDVVDAVRFLLVAPTNLAQLTISACVSRAQWLAIKDALDGNRCHGFIRRLDLPAEVPLYCPDVDSLLAATDNLAHLQSLRCGGAGIDALLQAVGGTLRRLAVHGRVEAIDFGRTPHLRSLSWNRHSGAVDQSITSIDLSHLRLTRIDSDLGFHCRELRDVRLPPTVTSIGRNFLGRCTRMTTVLDLSHMTTLQSIDDGFAWGSTTPGVLLPPTLTSIGGGFLAYCKSITAVLDLSHLSQLYCVGKGFAQGSSIPDVRLPSSVQSVGPGFVKKCTSLPAVLDLSPLLQLVSLGDELALGSSVSSVLLPPGVARAWYNPALEELAEH
jgi:hypothetical protein